jgi:hypothetical protein
MFFFKDGTGRKGSKWYRDDKNQVFWLGYDGDVVISGGNYEITGDSRNYWYGGAYRSIRVIKGLNGRVVSIGWNGCKSNGWGYGINVWVLRIGSVVHNLRLAWHIAAVGCEAALHH